MNEQQDSRDFVRLLTGKKPSVVQEQHDREVAQTAALEREQQEQTRSDRLRFIRQLTGKTTTTDKENTE